MAHLNLRPGEGVQGLNAREPVVTPTAPPATQGRSTSEILEALGFAFSATSAGLQGRPLPKDPAIARNEAQQRARRIQLEEEQIKQQTFQSNLNQAQTFLKMFKDVPEKSKGKFKELVSDTFKGRDPEFGAILGLAFEDPSVNSVLENFGVDPNDPFIQSLVEAHGSPAGAVKFLGTDQGQVLLKQQADDKFRQPVRSKLSRIVQSIDENLPKETMAKLRSRNSPGGVELTVGETLGVIPEILLAENQFSPEEMAVLERNPELLLEQGIISDKAAADFKMEQRKAALGKPSDKPSTADVSRGIIGERLNRELQNRGIQLTPTQIEGHAELIRQTQGQAIDAEGRPRDVTEQVVFKIVQQQQLEQTGVKLFPGLSESEVNIANLLQIDSQDPSAKQIVQKKITEANALGKTIGALKLGPTESALVAIENSLQDLLGLDDQGFLDVSKGIDIPGFGPIAGTLGQSTILSRGLSSEGRALRQDVQGLANLILKLNSGAAVTIPEFDRFEKQFGTGIFKTEAELLEGLRLAREGMERLKGTAFSSHSNDAVKVYQSRDGAILSVSNVFPIVDFKQPVTSGVNAPKKNLNVREGFNPANPVTDDATEDELQLRFDHLTRQGVR